MRYSVPILIICGFLGFRVLGGDVLPTNDHGTPQDIGQIRHLAVAHLMQFYLIRVDFLQRFALSDIREEISEGSRRTNGVVSAW